MKNICPVCEESIFEEDNDFDICPICGWENDGVQRNDHNYWGGANDLSVNEARIYYKLTLCKEKSIELSSIHAKHKEAIRKIHLKYKSTDYRIDGAKVVRELRKEHDKYVNQLNTLQRN